MASQIDSRRRNGNNAKEFSRNPGKARRLRKKLITALLKWSYLRSMVPLYHVSSKAAFSWYSMLAER